MGIQIFIKIKIYINNKISNRVHCTYRILVVINILITIKTIKIIHFKNV